MIVKREPIYFYLLCIAQTLVCFEYSLRFELKPSGNNPVPTTSTAHKSLGLRAGNGSRWPLRAYAAEYFKEILGRENWDADSVHCIVPSQSIIIRTLYMCSVLEFMPDYETFVLTHTFKKISYEQGIRHIHSLEHLEHVHKCGNPCFKVLTATKPVSINTKKLLGYIHVLCSSPSYHINSSRGIVECRQFSYYRNESHVLCLNPRTFVPQSYFRFRVSSAGTGGHTLHISITLPRDSPVLTAGGLIQKHQYVLKQALLNTLKIVFVLEDQCFWSYDFKSKHLPHEENLSRYRRFVLFPISLNSTE